MGLGSGRISFYICVTLIVMALIGLPMEPPHSPQFVMLVLVILINAVILAGIIVKVRLEVAQMRKEQAKWQQEMEERQLRD